MGFEVFERPPVRRRHKVATPFIGISGKTSRMYRLTLSAELCRLAPAFALPPGTSKRVHLLFDADRRRIAVRLDADGPYLLRARSVNPTHSCTRQVSCTDFVRDCDLAPGRYAAEPSGKKVVATTVEIPHAAWTDESGVPKHLKTAAGAAGKPS